MSRLLGSLLIIVALCIGLGTTGCGKKADKKKDDAAKKDKDGNGKDKNGNGKDKNGNQKDKDGNGKGKNGNGQAKAKDIIETAVAAGQFSTLAKALTAAKLVETLKGEGPFTVFAPNDEAFGKIKKEDLNALLKDKDKLTAVLTYHVVHKKVMAAEVVKMKEAPTVQGAKIMIKKEGDDVMINEAKVLKTDIACKNGVIHIIDAVLMPPKE